MHAACMGRSAQRRRPSPGISQPVSAGLEASEDELQLSVGHRRRINDAGEIEGLPPPQQAASEAAGCNAAELALRCG